MKSVFIVNGNGEYRRMFEDMGWKVADMLLGTPPDLVQFTGGEDVTPWLYGERAHRTTHYNFGRDMRELEVFGHCLERGIPMAGICRGGQFLNVMCGGRMWQDVDGHAIHGTHKAVDVRTRETFDVTSTHHQMMRVGDTGMIVAVASPVLSSYRHSESGDHGQGMGSDIEVVFYQRQKVLCFQPHPEFRGYPELRDRYFGYLTQYLGV